MNHVKDDDLRCPQHGEVFPEWSSCLQCVAESYDPTELQPNEAHGLTEVDSPHGEENTKEPVP